MLTESVLQQLSRASPTTCALSDLRRSYTWPELHERVGRAAGFLKNHGLIRGDRVGLALRDDADFIVLVLAALRLGLVVVPIDWRSKPQEIALLAGGLALRATIECASAGRRSGQIRWQMRDDQAPAVEVAQIGADDPCMILLSSGTTGMPAGALLAGAALEHRLTFGGNAAFELAGHRYLSFLPLCFANGVCQALRNLVAGNTVIIHPSFFTARELIRAANGFEATYVGVVPTTIRSLLRLADAELAGLKRLRAVRVAGSAMTIAERREWQQRVGVTLYHGYGASAVGPISHWSSDYLETRPESVGRPYEWIELRIVGTDGRVLPNGETGILECRGPSLAAALLALTGEVSWLRGGWYAPGDVARLDEAGFLYLEGRATDVIIRQGVNVYPELVESALRLHPAVADAAVVGRPSAGADEEIAAFVVLAAPASPEDLHAHCRVHLSSKYRPAEIQIVPDLPRTPSGKVKRSDVRRSMGAHCADAAVAAQELKS